MSVIITLNFTQPYGKKGLLGERLFSQFDVKGNGFIDFDEFISGLSVCCRGTVDEKIHFMFNMYDVGQEGSVTRQELSLLLNHVPKYILREGGKRQSKSSSDIHYDSDTTSEVSRPFDLF